VDSDRIIDVLMRKNKGNGVLTGAAGVGKTALAEGLALRIVKGDVPHPLQGVRVFEVSMGKLVAGTIFRGQFEERLEKVMEALKACRPSILFIDEMHLIWGAGRAEGAPMDAGNLLKPVLARGEVRILGATTVEEYRRYICRDEALSRRFEEIRLEEPSGELLMNMLRPQTEGLALHHGIKIPGALIQSAVSLTDHFLPNRRQPDKSVDLLDTSSVRAVQNGRAALTEADLLETMARLTGLSIGTLQGESLSQLRNLSRNLKQQIIGQDHAMDKIAATLTYRRHIQGVKDRNLGTFLFCGATGVGKTKTAQLLAEHYCGDLRKLLHLDMAEYTLPDGMNKLIGVPDGFVGGEKEGVLASFLHTHGSGVILCDEIEKAHPEVHRLFPGILDNGRIRTAQGRLLDTRQSVIVFTTNAITPAALDRQTIGFGKSVDQPDPLDLLSEHFPRELLGRFDEIILFNTLTALDLRHILEQQIKEAVLHLAAREIRVEFEMDRLCNHLLSNKKDSKTGARGIARLIEQKLLQPIALLSLQQEHSGAPLTVILDEDSYAQDRVVAH
jgi:ATP-dependent Clp protease ATP-binding subunit ClpA